jgi:ADP-heptose:LPS heptosyltransferase
VAVTVERIAVLRALPGVGDLLCAVPALRALRSTFPRAHITFIGLDGRAWFTERFARYVDDHVVLPAWPGLPEVADDVDRAHQFTAAMRRHHFDLALQLHGDGTVTNPLIASLGARRCAGLAGRHAYRPDPATFVPARDGASEVERTLLPLRAVGVCEDDRHLDFPEWREDRVEIAPFGLAPGTYVVLHPGATLASRRWDPRGFAIVGEFFAAAGTTVVLTGLAAERPAATAVMRAMHADAVDLTGRLSLGGAAAMVRRAALVVTNDTGMSHIAAAVATPSVVVFRVTDPHRWKPEGTRHIAVHDDGDLQATASRVTRSAVP